MAGEKNGWRGGNKKILGGGGQGLRSASYLDYIETTGIMNCGFSLMDTRFFAQTHSVNFDDF